MAAKKRLFITGGSGYVGSVIIEQAVANYEIHALSRTDSSDHKLRALGAVPIRGDLTSLDTLKQECKAADAVIHLATAYQFGGRGTYDDVWPIDLAAIDAMAEALAGTDKPLVVTSGTLVVEADPSGAETDEDSPLNQNPINTRHKFEVHALGLASRGIHVSSVRLAAYTYGRGGSGIGLFMGMAAKAGAVVCIDGGKNHITTVHVDDAARLYLLVVQKGKAGEAYHASSATDVRFWQSAEAMASALSLPVRDISFETAKEEMGALIATFLAADNRASGAKAVRELGWKPTGPGILDDIREGSYQAVAKELKNSG
jgi:nucleoside-diphosphate-sugar epimerase